MKVLQNVVTINLGEWNHQQFRFVSQVLKETHGILMPWRTIWSSFSGIVGKNVSLARPAYLHVMNIRINTTTYNSDRFPE